VVTSNEQIQRCSGAQIDNCYVHGILACGQAVRPQCHQMCSVPPRVEPQVGFGLGCPRAHVVCKGAERRQQAHVPWWCIGGLSECVSGQVSKCDGGSEACPAQEVKGHVMVTVNREDVWLGLRNALCTVCMKQHGRDGDVMKVRDQLLYPCGQNALGLLCGGSACVAEPLAVREVQEDLGGEGDELAEGVDGREVE
jgi:hypothetical protein